ncbi:MAG: pyridoxal phosphate-dependent aminotransferase, partial [Bifidobacteriales bacterium]|nr:pyridoxal phosphate-dependent aminotransferase [Bifidobacteriales bacterium]
FALDGFSKSLAAPHAKVGWIQVSGPADQVAEAKRHLDLIADDYLPMSLLITRDMEAMLSDVPGQTSRVRERVRGNLEILKQTLSQKDSCVSLLRPEGGWNVLLRFPQVIDEEELILDLIKSYGLTGQPGYFFDMPGNGYLALSLLPESLELRRNVNSVVSAIGKIVCI